MVRGRRWGRGKEKKPRRVGTGKEAGPALTFWWPGVKKIIEALINHKKYKKLNWQSV